MKCKKCGKNIVEYKEKRVYYSPQFRGNIIEYICNDCYVDLGRIKSDDEDD